MTALSECLNPFFCAFLSAFCAFLSALFFVHAINCTCIETNFLMWTVSEMLRNVDTWFWSNSVVLRLTTLSVLAQRNVFIIL